MPIVRIEISAGFPPVYKKALLDGVHEALVFAFKIPDDDRQQVLFELPDGHFDTGGRSRQCCLVQITAFQGRSREAKRALYARIVENLANAPGIAPADVLIVLNEQDRVNWGVQGGQVADEVDLGFNVNV
jgi:phenylpyruvate tautomerase PptA (4-oxalocrotonate tautomerase family)